MKYLLSHLKSYPAAHAEDVYKFIFQSVFGPAHLIRDKEKFYKLLLQEWNDTSKVDRMEPMIEKLGEFTSLARLNIRPFRKGGGSVDEICEICINSVNSAANDLDKFESETQRAINLLHETGSEDLSTDLNNFFEKMRTQNFPAVHHSDLFRNKYRPSYRVIDEKLLK